MTNPPKTSSLLGSSLLAAALVAIWIGERVLGEGALRQVATGAGGLVLVLAVSLRLFAWRTATGDVRGVEGRVLAGYLGVLGSLALYALSTDAGMEALGLADEAKDRAVVVLSVLWAAMLLVSSSSLFFVELAYSRMPIAVSVELRRVRTAAAAGLTLACAAVFVLSLNYVATARDVRRDVSYFKTTAPSQGTVRMLQKLDAPMKAVLFWRKTDDVLQQVEPYFGTLHAHAKKLRYEVRDAALAPELARKHRVNGNGFVLLLRGEGAAQKGQSFRIGNELTEARPQLKKLDALFQQSFAKLARPERTLLMTVGHAERNSRAQDAATGDGMQVMTELCKRLNLKTDKLGLAQGLGNAVPDGSSAVMVAGAREPFLPEEVDTLLGYVRKGGRLLLMIDPDTDDGLAPLLAGLGVERLGGTLNSDKQHMQRAHDASDRALVFSNSYSSHPTVTTASRYQSEVATVFVRGAGLGKAPSEPTPRTRVTFALRSGPTFYRDLDGDFDRDANEALESTNLVAAVTVTEKPGAPEGRAVIVGDGDFMTDKVATNNGNMMVFVDALGWLVGNEDLSAEVSSEEDVRIEHSRDQDKLWFYATTFAMPMPVLGLGLWVSRRRRRRAEAVS